MKNSSYAVISLCLFLAVQVSLAQNRGFGLGVIIGEPTGISAKLWTSPINAFDFAIGWSTTGGRQTDFHMDYLWHSFNTIHSSERFPLYYGFGGRIITGPSNNGSVAVRGVFGIAWLPHNTPIDIFLELVPSLQLTPGTGFGIDAGIGARFFFWWSSHLTSARLHKSIIFCADVRRVWFMMQERLFHVG